MASIALLCAGALWSSAQQQTGAPAGIAVPTPSGNAGTPTEPGAAPQSAVFRIHLVDGRNGEAMRNVHLTLWYDEQAGAGYALTTDTRGMANMPAPVGQPVRVLVSLLDVIACRKRATDDVPTGFNIQGIAAKGLSAENTCGRISERTHPGELALFARPPRWYEGINHGAGN